MEEIPEAQGKLGAKSGFSTSLPLADKRGASAAFGADNQRPTSLPLSPALAARPWLLGPARLGWLQIKGWQKTHLPTSSCACPGLLQ